MRVLSLSTLFPSPAQPGFGKFVANQMAAVAARGDVDLVMINPIGLPPWPLAALGRYRALAACPPTSALGPLTVHHPRFTLLPLLGGDSNSGRIARAVLPLARRLHAQAPFDLVDAQFFFPDGPAAVQVAQALGLPCTIKARGSDIHYWSSRPTALAQIRTAGAAAAGMLAVSAALKHDMAALGLPDEQIAVHYTGLDHIRFKPAPRGQARARVAASLGLPDDGAPLLLCPGALIAIKGQALAIRALVDIPGTRLALAGKGADEAELRALVAALGLGERVHFLGQVGHDLLPTLMSAADVVVLPSEREGLANVWIEALACGTPLVIPPIGGAAEVVTSPAAGRLAARDPAAIAAAVNALITGGPDPAEAAQQAARFSWEENAARLVAFWRGLARA